MNHPSKPGIAVRFWRSLKSGFRFGGYGGGYGYNDPYGGFYRMLPGAQFDYRREAGILWENSVVLSAIKWMQRAFPEATLTLQRPRADGETDSIEHPALNVVRNPNPWHDASVLWNGLILSDVVDGNGYWRVIPSRRGLPVELYYVPHFQISPRWGAAGEEFISYYEYRVDGKVEQWPVESVVQFRNGIDPLNPRRGLSDLGAIFRDVCTHNEATGAAAALMRNRGIPGLVFVPSEAIVGLTTDQLEHMKAMAAEKLTGERRGEMLIPSVPGKFDSVGFNPSEMDFGGIRNMSATSICAAMGFDPMVLGLDSNSKTFANKEEAAKNAYEFVMCPLWKRIAGTLDHQILARFWPADHAAGCYFEFDTRKVQSLQEDRNAKIKRLVAAAGGPILSVNEARADINYPDVDDGAEIRKAAVVEPAAEEAPNGGETGGKPKNDDEKD